MKINEHKSYTLDMTRDELEKLYRILREIPEPKAVEWVEKLRTTLYTRPPLGTPSEWLNPKNPFNFKHPVIDWNQIT